MYMCGNAYWISFIHLIFQIEFIVFSSIVLSGPLYLSPLTSSHCKFWCY